MLMVVCTKFLFIGYLPHERITVVAWEVLCSFSPVQTLKSKGNKLELVEDHISFIMINELQLLARRSMRRKGMCDSMDTYLSRNMSIFFPNFGGKLVLCD